MDGLLRALIEEGIVIQDVPRGLVDFPGLRADGTEFLFCYEPTDGPRIRYWHNLTDGYAGRRPLEELDR